MSGHSKWSTIKHKKGRADAKRGKLFTKIIREITVAAREAGGDPDSNPRLRAAVAAAKAANMPADNIKRAIDRGTGALDGVSYEEISFEGYGPGGVAVMLELLTDNRNRTTPEIRHLFTRYGGNLGENGCVSWLFTRKGMILVPRSEEADEDEIMELALEAGAEDLDTDDTDYFRIYTSPDELHAVKDQLEAIGSGGRGGTDGNGTVEHHSPGRQGRTTDDSSDGGIRRPRRRAECVGQLRHRRRNSGRRLIREPHGRPCPRH